MKILTSRKKIIFILGSIIVITLLSNFTMFCRAETKEAALEITQRTNPEHYKKPYVFTTDWFTERGRIPLWEKILAHLKGKPNINYLEVGVFEGRSLLWMLENIFTDPSSKASAVDIFQDAYYKIFLKNLTIGGFKKRVTVIKGYSQVKLRELPLNSFDVIYIDGSHEAIDVLTDALLCWGLLKADGIMIFDDYEWKEWQGKTMPLMSRPEIAIDAFIGVFQPYIEVLHKGWQVVIRKK
ncbi:MAG: class I SAM-dependent methyltransferase [Candidatus Omnitrophica bacterium]|nr:class I SAM-dependent methyltransferase [Candidatus Omnitrophota bacterium]